MSVLTIETVDCPHSNDTSEQNAFRDLAVTGMMICTFALLTSKLGGAFHAVVGTSLLCTAISAIWFYSTNPGWKKSMAKSWLASGLMFATLAILDLQFAISFADIPPGQLCELGLAAFSTYCMLRLDQVARWLTKTIGLLLPPPVRP